MVSSPAGGEITLRLYLYIGVTHVAGVEEVLPLLWIFGGRVAGGKMAWHRAGVRRVEEQVNQARNHRPAAGLCFTVLFHLPRSPR